MSRRAEILVIGNEILSGKVRDTNSPFLIDELRALGVVLQRLTVIADATEVIAREVSAASARADFVLSTGGVGPTLDDLTFDGIAAAFGVELVRSAHMEKIIQDFFHGSATEAHLTMADLPAGSDLLFSPGLVFPVVRTRNVYIFPGSPEILRKKFLELRDSFREAPFIIRRVFVTLEEGLLAPLLDGVAAAVPGVDVGSYPVYEQHDYAVQITLEAKDGAAVMRAFEWLVAALPAGTIVRVA